MLSINSMILYLLFFFNKERMSCLEKNYPFVYLIKCDKLIIGLKQVLTLQKIKHLPEEKHVSPKAEVHLLTFQKMEIRRVKVVVQNPSLDI